MKRIAGISITFALALIALGGTAKADNYDICYRRIQAELGPYTDITWMRKVWDCTRELDEAKGKSKAAKPNVKPPATGSAQCSFETRIGECKATATVSDTGENAGGFNAEVTVKSSAGSCSKVVYLLDGLPQHVYIQGGDQSVERVFRTSAIAQADITVKECGLYAGGKAPAEDEERRARYGKCLGDKKMERRLDDEYARAINVIGSPTIEALNEFVVYFSSSWQDNPHWIRRNELVQKCR